MDTLVVDVDQMLDASFRREFGEVADVLIPAGDGAPSATEAGVATIGLDLVLAARPDLKPDLVRITRYAVGMTASELRAASAADFDMLSLAVVAAYFMSPRVRTVYGYYGNLPTLPDRSIPGAAGAEETESLIGAVREEWTATHE